jgi:hypothetical protein
MIRTVSILILLVLSSCRRCCIEVWSIEKYPNSWSDVIIEPEDHWHFRDPANNWYCVELDADTTYLEVIDTILVEKLNSIYYIRTRTYHKTQ